MNDFGLNEMQEMQKKLQDKYKNKWEQISPETGKNKLLWMIGEIGEVIDIVKKHGGSEASADVELRKDLVEEMADVLMFYNDVMLCYGISVEELKQAYTAKFEKNMTRWYSAKCHLRLPLCFSILRIKSITNRMTGNTRPTLMPMRILSPAAWVM